MIAIPKELRGELRFQVSYNIPGKCPKCGHTAWLEPQAGAMPPSAKCICGWRDYEPKNWKGYRRLS
jgi:hypothetical protein